MPLKNRGIYFSKADDEPACIVVDDVSLSYAFHISMWVRLDAVNDGPLWGKHDTVMIGTTADSKLSGSLNGEYEKTTSSIDNYEVGKWTWLAVDFVLNTGNTSINYWVDGTLKTNVQCNDNYLLDKAPAAMTIGCLKDENDETIEWRQNSYILDFRLCMGGFSADLTIYWELGCGEQYDCWSDCDGN
jgi:hypothetical protein